jgi:hypothetical protein
MIKKGSFVEIMQIVLETDERADNLPEETRKTPLKLWAKGILTEDSELGSVGCILTTTGRKLEGNISQINPSYDYSFGHYIEEISHIGSQAKSLLWGDEIE